MLFVWKTNYRTLFVSVFLLSMSSAHRYYHSRNLSGLVGSPVFKWMCYIWTSIFTCTAGSPSPGAADFLYLSILQFVLRASLPQRLVALPFFTFPLQDRSTYWMMIMVCSDTGQLLSLFFCLFFRYVTVTRRREFRPFYVLNIWRLLKLKHRSKLKNINYDCIVPLNDLFVLCI